MSAGRARVGGRPARTLALDASTSVGTVAVFVGDELAAQGRAEMRGAADELRGESGLMSVLVESLREAGVQLEQGDRIICGAGPGSFTGLRVSASMAKGMAMGFGVPLLAIPSLALVAGADGPLAAGRYLATMDAMRGERYASLLTFGADGALLDVGPVALHPAAEVGARAQAQGAVVIGADGTPAAGPRAARALAALCARGVDASPVSLDGWEPNYGRVAEAQARWEAAHGRPLPRG